MKVPGCFPSCIITGSVAHCAFKKLHRVPALPTHITHLYLEMNRIGEINSTSLEDLTQLQELDLSGQSVPLLIRNNTFRRQHRLRKLTLGNNRGLQLEPLAFEGLSGLQNLHLDYCSLKDSILKDNYLEPLSSLKTLDLSSNDIRSLQPSLFFANMTNLTEVNLKLNRIDQICESDLAGFQGKHFKFLNLNSVPLRLMSDGRFDWNQCGNPFSRMSFETLDLSSSGLGVAKLQKFFRAIQGTKISNIKLSGHIGKGFSFSNLPDPDHTTFDGLRNSSMLSLDLSKNSIFALQQGVFAPLEEVTAIDVSQNSLNQIHRGAFDGLQGHLVTLNLSHNLLGEVRSYTFTSLTNLKVLDLSHNHIGVLGYDSFSGLPNLKALFLTGNSLRDLGFPASLPSLDYLLLNDNKLQPSAVNSVTRFASNIMHLNIADNRLTNLGDVYVLLSELKHLQNLLYGGNTIRWCVPSGQVGPNKLQVLDLRSSSLQFIWAQGKCLNLFDNLKHLRGLRLSSNGLQSLPRGIFKGLTSVVEMDLSSNSLTNLPPDVLPKTLKWLSLSDNYIASPDPAAFSYLQMLDLSENRFHCNSNMKTFLKWLDKTNVTLLSPARELRCEFPPDLHDVSLIDYSAQITQQQKKV